MTIAKRLIILLALPLLALLGLGVFTRPNWRGRVPQPVCVGDPDQSLAVSGTSPGHSRGSGCKCGVICWRPTRRTRPKPGRPLTRAKRRSTACWPIRGLTRSPDERDRRLFNEYRDLSREYIASAKQFMASGCRGTPGSGGCAMLKGIVGRTRLDASARCRASGSGTTKNWRPPPAKRPLMPSGGRCGKCW